MNKKIIISQSIMWAAAILVVSIVEEKEFAVLMLVILATTSLITLKKGKFINMPDCGDYNAPIIYTIPLQILAYVVACLRGTDLDQPRNLAKSVTVE